MSSNGEVEGPDDASGRTQVERSSSGAPDAAGLEPRADNLPQRPRRHYREVLIREILSQKRSPYFSAAMAQSTPPTRQPARMWRPFQVRT